MEVVVDVVILLSSLLTLIIVVDVTNSWSVQKQILNKVPNYCTVFLICQSNTVPCHPGLNVRRAWTLEIQNSYKFVKELANCFVFALQTDSEILGIFFFEELFL
jgi:hypothetical protein